MRRRIVGALVGAVLATGSLTACRTNVGYAATVDGTRIQESTISGYLTAKSKPVTQQQQDGTSLTTPIRTFVLQTIIDERFFQKILAALPGGAPSQATLDEVEREGLKGSSVNAAVVNAGVVGYSSSFNRLFIKTRVANVYLSSLQQSPNPPDLRTIASKVKLPVSVNPRYGSYDPNTISLNGAASAGVPSFIKVQPQGSTVSTGTPPATP